ncbi:MAPEG family protein [Sneathiella sp.]|uniref:MAPEG family protein n=1 Tax=Sneathiella sp. TaxID=1964365 RepID=UPI002636F1D4|nr:MAPEG family protein [Sneathiella sp.]MDF2369030.1 MAPEG family protein [Sneathiella sp.]
MHVTMTPIFAALLGLIFFFLSLRTSLERRRAKVSLGDGGDPGLQGAIRAHGNFIEYVPISLLLMAFLEMRAVSIYVVAVLGVMLVAGRCLHAIGISRANASFRFRQIGAVLSLLVLLIASLWLLYTYLI